MHGSVLEMKLEIQEKMRQLLDSKGESWLVAAMVESSIGYYSPNMAKNRIKSILQDGRWFAERTMCCFANTTDELDFDVRCFEGLEKNIPEKAKILIKSCDAAKDCTDFAINGMISCAYPTMLS